MKGPAQEKSAPVGETPPEQLVTRESELPATLETVGLDGKTTEREVSVSDLGLDDIPVKRPEGAKLVREVPTLRVRETKQWTEYTTVWTVPGDAEQALRCYTDQCENFSVAGMGAVKTGQGDTFAGDEVKVTVEPANGALRITELVRVRTEGW